METLVAARGAQEECDTERGYNRLTLQKMLGCLAMARANYQFAADVATDVAERLKLATKTSFTYQQAMGTDGRLDLRDINGTMIRPILVNGAEAARRAAELDPTLQYQIRLAQNHLRLHETSLSLRSGEVALMISPYHNSLLGADQQRRMAMVHLSENVDGQIINTTVSLDQSDFGALREVLATFGVELAAGTTIEDVSDNIMRISINSPRSLAIDQLAHSRVNPLKSSQDGTPEFSQRIIDTVYAVYDTTLERRQGGKFLAGRRDLSQHSALEWTLNFPAELDDLISRMSRATDETACARLLYDHVAWLEQPARICELETRRADGCDVPGGGIWSQNYDIGSYRVSSALAGNSDRAAGVSHDGICPISSENSSLEISLAQQVAEGKISQSEADRQLSKANQSKAIKIDDYPVGAVVDCVGCPVCHNNGNRAKVCGKGNQKEWGCMNHACECYWEIVQERYHAKPDVTQGAEKITPEAAERSRNFELSNADGKLVKAEFWRPVFSDDILSWRVVAICDKRTGEMLVIGDETEKLWRQYIDTRGVFGM